MAATVQRILLWRGTVEDRPGALAEVLEPIAAQGADLEIVMGYREAGEPQKAVIELYPVRGKKLTETAEGAGLRPSHVPAILVAGSNRAGLAHRAARAIADAGITISFLIAQTVGARYSAVFGFENDTDAARAMGLIRKAVK